MRTLFAVAVLLLVAACQAPPAEMTEAEIAQIEAAVLERAEAYLDAWAAGTPEDRCRATQAFFHPDHMVYLTGGAPQGRADHFDYCMGGQEDWRTFTGGWTETSVRVVSPDAAMFLGRMDNTWEHATGRIDHYPAGAQLLLFERAAEGWMITMYEWSNGPIEEAEQG
jgi:hypothetical protein